MSGYFRLTATQLRCVILLVGIAQSVYREQRESTTNTDPEYFATLSEKEIAVLTSRENQNPRALKHKLWRGFPAGDNRRANSGCGCCWCPCS